MKYTTDFRSTYYYEDAPVYKNYFKLKDQSRLLSLETDISLNRLSELNARPIKGRFSWTHLSNIHQYIFGDIYPFAGKSRNENIIKGDTQFCSCEFIHQSFEQMITSLKSEKYLKGLKKKVLSDRLGYYMSELNMIHPFREGNGRAIREYIRCLALARGVMIHWDLIDKDRLLQAIISSVERNHHELSRCIFDSFD
jgi:cell filamentation protein